MDPLISLGGAALKSAGALVSRYRPAGVARVGSPEDRAQTYRRFLDAATRFQHQTRFMQMIDPGLQELAAQVITGQMEAIVEMNSALAAVQLCGSAPVIIAAEGVNWGRLLQADKDERAAVRQFSAECKAFLDAARHDLAYNPRWWQLWRKRKERKLIAEQVAKNQPAALPSQPAVTDRDG